MQRTVASDSLDALVLLRAGLGALFRGRPSNLFVAAEKWQFFVTSTVIAAVAGPALPHWSAKAQPTGVRAGQVYKRSDAIFSMGNVARAPPGLDPAPSGTLGLGKPSLPGQSSVLSRFGLCALDRTVFTHGHGVLW